MEVCVPLPGLARKNFHLFNIDMFILLLLLCLLGHYKKGSSSGKNWFQEEIELRNREEEEFRDEEPTIFKKHVFLEANRTGDKLERGIKQPSPAQTCCLNDFKAAPRKIREEYKYAG